MTFDPKQLSDRKRDSFIIRPQDNRVARAVDAIISNNGANPVPITGSFTFAGATVIKVYNLTLTNADTEYSQALSANTKALLVKTRGGAELKVTFTAGESGTKYYTVERGVEQPFDNLTLTGKTIYMQSPKAGEIVEIVEFS